KQGKEETGWKAALALVRQSGSLEKARQLCNHYLKKARQQLSFLPDLPERHILDEITVFVENRNF
ncbi:MAG: heptaprenyl diphosphate synthase, partial [Thermacetogeniaceae bacterium]